MIGNEIRVLDGVRPSLSIDALCDQEEIAVARLLEWGRDNARRIDNLAAESGIESRRVQEIISHLLLEHHWPIGTSMAEPFGNYLIESSNDLQLSVSLLHRRGLSNLRRAAALRRMSLQQFIALIQNELDLEERKQ